jgi:phage terminase small subunit
VSELTYKQRLFVSAFIGEAKGNASEAARIAGYGNTPGSSSVFAHRLLRKAKIKAAIERRVSVVALTANEVLARVAEQATADIGEYLDIDHAGDYTVNLERARKRGKLRNIRKIKQGEFGPEIELKDSFPALVQLGKYHGLWDREPSKGNEVAEAIKNRLIELTKERLQRRAEKPPDASGP